MASLDLLLLLLVATLRHPFECAPPRLLIDGTGKGNTHRGSISFRLIIGIWFFFFEIYPESSFSSLPPSQLCPHNRCRLLIAKRFALNCSRELVWNIGLREGRGVVNAVVNSLIVNRGKGSNWNDFIFGRFVKCSLIRRFESGRVKSEGGKL